MSASIPPTNDALDPATREALQALRAATEARPADVARLQSRLAAPATPRPVRWPLAAIPALLLVGGLGAWWAADTPATLDWAEGQLALDGVSVATTTGRGDATLDGNLVRLDWVVGTVETEEAAAHSLLVVTAEAEWAVAGVGALERDRFGTHVADAPGAVCLGERDGDTCLPTHAAGWLGRAHALAALGQHRSAADAFATAQDLSADDDAVRSEASAGRADALVRAGEWREGAQAAEEALADVPGTREMRLRMLAARAFLTLGDCESALPHLQALPEPTEEEAAHIERCEAQLRSPE